MNWLDNSGDLWLFGGGGYDSVGYADIGELNDLWKFDPIDDTWTWITGSNKSDQSGVYGMEGTSVPGNVPGARTASVAWTDISGNFWLLGGYGFDAVGTYGFLNDLWEFDSTSNTWTWVSGEVRYPRKA